MLSNHQAFALFRGKLSTNSKLFHRTVGIALILWGKLWVATLKSGFGGGQNADQSSSEDGVPTDPTNNTRRANPVGTIFRINARSKRSVMPRVTRK